MLGRKYQYPPSCKSIRKAGIITEQLNTDNSDEADSDGDRQIQECLMSKSHNC